MTNLKLFQHLLILLLMLSPLSAAFAECSREDVDHYLDRGFSTDQITQLCGQKQSSPASKEPQKSIPVTPIADEKPAPAVTTKPKKVTTVREPGYLETVLAAEIVEITPHNLIITQDRCFTLQEEESIAFEKSICAEMQTTIARAGLEIVKVTNPIPLLRDAELIIKGSISRQTKFKQKVNKQDRKTFYETYPTAPETMNIAVKAGHKSTKVAAAIEKLIR